ncbi:MAG: hypothetical protein ACHQ9S_15365 [Candidatus Binatia bacterium]
MKAPRQRIITHLAVITATLLIVATAGSAAVVVVPNAQTSVEGNYDNTWPFSCGVLYTSQRYQQVYLGSEVGSGTITQIAFRPDGVLGGAFGPTTITGVTITLSSTSAAPDSMSLTFASNVGADVTTVFSGNLVLQSADTGGPPRDFDIVVPLTTRFTFNGATGKNLLLDVTIPTCVTTTPFDAQDTSADPVSRTFTLSSGAGSATADLGDTVGLVTQFTLSPASQGAPTLGGVGLFVCVLLLLGIAAWSLARGRFGESRDHTASKL